MKITKTDFLRRMEFYIDEVQKLGIIEITIKGKPSVMLISNDEYERLQSKLGADDAGTPLVTEPPIQPDERKIYYTTLEQDGDDLILVLPPEIVAELNLKEGDEMEFTHNPGEQQIFLKKI